MLVCITQFAVAQTPQKAGVEINKAPLRDLSVAVKTSLESKELDLDKPFVVEYIGVIDKNGKLDLKTGKFTRVEGDKKSADMAKQAIIAVSDSAYLTYLRDLNSDNVVIFLSQNDSDFTARFSASTVSEARANSLRSVLSILVLMAEHQMNKSEATENDKATLNLLKATTVISQVKTVIMTLSLPKTVFHEMIKSELVKQKQLSEKS